MDINSFHILMRLAALENWFALAALENWFAGKWIFKYLFVINTFYLAVWEVGKAYTGYAWK